MELTMLKGKIHRATVTQAELDYVGSITIDTALLKASGILEYEKVQIVDVNNGQRFETYTIAGEENSGVICLNGAAARCVQKGDKVIIMAYCGFAHPTTQTTKRATESAARQKNTDRQLYLLTTTIRCRKSRSMKNTEK